MSLSVVVSCSGLNFFFALMNAVALIALVLGVRALSHLPQILRYAALRRCYLALWCYD